VYNVYKVMKKGGCYTRQEIRELVGGGSVHDYLPHEKGRVLCACLSQEYFAGERMVILVGSGPGVQAEAEIFCAQGTAVPVFFKKAGHLWEYAGMYKKESFSDDPEVITEYEKSSGRMNLTGVIFLKDAGI
jgi:hypothetical protein